MSKQRAHSVGLAAAFGYTTAQKIDNLILSVNGTGTRVRAHDEARLEAG